VPAQSGPTIVECRVDGPPTVTVVGFAVGAVPFVIVLYFFFENVNRLLPSGI
jgi:hypothetical protein